MTSRDDVARVLDPVLGPAGLVLEDVTVTPAGRRRVVRVAVDRVLVVEREVTEPVPPLTLDEVADATRLVGDALDVSDVMGAQPYTLEVTSPGVDRALTEPRHFQRNVGRLLSVTLSGGEVVGGRVVRAGSGTVVLAVPEGGPGRGAAGTTEREIGLGDVTRARVEVEFSRPDGEAGGVPAAGETEEY